MLLLSIMHDYFLWHYTRAFRELFNVWLNFLWFMVHFFSIPALAASWFSPFKRIVEERRSGFSFEDIAGYVIINLFSRLVGAFLRTIIMLVGAIAVVLTVSIGVVVYVSWIFLPFVMIAALAAGVAFLFV